ncbi:THAP domain-containing protein 2-like [Aphis craccivora]|uniref:THAP domain-containing protein 2-like n=1 Tax=Aphis craccivora TaxID=307492 RepID=A0A6G0YVT2_APHCR|nr:THAP domain-containing protein 2-like [Aphis craccivora]
MHTEKNCFLIYLSPYYNGLEHFIYNCGIYYTEKICCAYGCNNRDGIAKNIKLFRFPDDKNRKKWLDLVQRKNFSVTKSSRLCSAHFELSEFVEAPGKLILKNTANPSNFNFPTTPTKKSGRKKENIRFFLLFYISKNNNLMLSYKHESY